jgi:hypothetical protein
MENIFNNLLYFYCIIFLFFSFNFIYFYYYFLCILHLYNYFIIIFMNYYYLNYFHFKNLNYYLFIMIVFNFFSYLFYEFLFISINKFMFIIMLLFLISPIFQPLHIDALHKISNIIQNHPCFFIFPFHPIILLNFFLYHIEYGNLFCNHENRIVLNMFLNFIFCKLNKKCSFFQYLISQVYNCCIYLYKIFQVYN